MLTVIQDVWILAVPDLVFFKCTIPLNEKYCTISCQKAWRKGRGYDSACSLPGGFAGCWLIPVQVGRAAGSCFLGN